MATLLVKSVYAPVKKTDGYRVLTDRLWPGAISAEALRADGWMKEPAPSPCLRIWFKHHPEQWSSLRNADLIELKLYAAIAALKSFCRGHKKITLLYASGDALLNHALLLLDFLNHLQAGQAPGYPLFQQLLRNNKTA